VPIYARLHLQHLPRLLTKSQNTKTPAWEAMVDESPRHGEELDWAEANGVEGDEWRRRRWFPAVR
jgi:hypothetical protein